MTGIMTEQREKHRAARGRVILNTGHGKGKTTAALGTAFRALGHDHKVCVIQFLKGQGDYGERLLAEKFDNLDWFICGRGFIFNRKKLDEDKRVAEEGFALATEKINSDIYDLVILDEITYLPLFGFLDVRKIVELITHRPPRLSVIMTGRDAPPELIAIADTVSVVEPLKHAFKEGIKAQKGIEF